MKYSAYKTTHTGQSGKWNISKQEGFDCILSRPIVVLMKHVQFPF